MQLPAIPEFIKEFYAKNKIVLIISAVVIIMVILYFTVFRKRNKTEPPPSELEEEPSSSDSPVESESQPMVSDSSSPPVSPDGVPVPVPVQNAAAPNVSPTIPAENQPSPPMVYNEPLDDKYYIILGNELEGISGSEMANVSIDACKTECDNDSNCLAFFMDTNTNKCALKSSVTNFIKPNFTAQTYIKKSSTLPTEFNSFLTDYQVNHAGERLAQKNSEEPVPFSSTFYDCASQCKSNVDCQGFSFNNEDQKCVIRTQSVNLTNDYMNVAKFQYYQRRIGSPLQAAPPPPAAIAAISPASAPAQMGTPTATASAPAQPGSQMEQAQMGSPTAPASAPTQSGSPLEQTQSQAQAQAQAQEAVAMSVTGALDVPVDVSGDCKSSRKAGKAGKAGKAVKAGKAGKASAPASAPAYDEEEEEEEEEEDDVYARYEARDNVLFGETVPEAIASYSLLKTCFTKCDELEECDTVVENELGVCSLYSRTKADGGFVSTTPVEPKYYFKVGK